MRPIDADALKKVVEDFPNCYNGWSDTYDKAFIIGAIEEEPTIDAVSVEWIPCEERLPSERGEYLVTVTFEGDTYVECLHYGKPTMANREVKGECFYDSDDEWGDVVYDTEVIAWMPLPKPYGERESE